MKLRFIKNSTICLSFLALVSMNALAKLIVLEPVGENETYEHAMDVYSIACPSSAKVSKKQHAYELSDRYHDCRVAYINNFITPNSNPGIEKPLSWADIVNISMGTQMPEFPDAMRRLSASDAQEIRESYEKAIVIYLNQSRFFKKTINLNREKLFVTAAGNGISIFGGLQTKGVVLTEKTPLSPQNLQMGNLVKVAAVNISSFRPEAPQPFRLADYSNYSLDLVDVAAPVETNHLGEIMKGTSFASPYVARLSQKILSKFPQLYPHEIKSILLKSCYIPDVDLALWASQDLNINGEKSIIWTALFDSKRKVRNQTMESLPGFIPVKCGGIVVDDLALTCAQNYTSTSGSTTPACLSSHAKIINSDQKYLDLLKKLWLERGI